MKILKLIPLFTSVLILLGCTNSKENNKTFNIIDFSNNNQILLTNQADFKGHTSLNGASSFLIEYNKSIYAVTAKHLIGESGGVDPEILPIDLPKKIDLWKMYPRVPNKISNDTILISNSEFKSVNTDADILLLKTNRYKGGLCILKPKFEIPKLGDSLFIIGCPYSEVNCRQNVYDCNFSFFDNQSQLLVFELKKGIELAGFSGSPIIDKHGNVVAVLTSGWIENEKMYVGGVSIKEIINFKN